jgi:hypothetical protein
MEQWNVFSRNATSPSYNKSVEDEASKTTNGGSKYSADFNYEMDERNYCNSGDVAKAA